MINRWDVIVIPVPIHRGCQGIEYAICWPFMFESRCGSPQSSCGLPHPHDTHIWVKQLCLKVRLTRLHLRWKTACFLTIFPISATVWTCWWPKNGQCLKSQVVPSKNGQYKHIYISIYIYILYDIKSSTKFSDPSKLPPWHLTEINPLRLQVLLEFAAPKPRPGDLVGPAGIRNG